MKSLQLTFLIIFACVFSTQAIRHVHVYVIGYEESILAPSEAFYDFQEEVRMEESTDELLAEYETSQEEIKQLKEAEQSGIICHRQYPRLLLVPDGRRCGGTCVNAFNLKALSNLQHFVGVIIALP